MRCEMPSKRSTRPFRRKIKRRRSQDYRRVLKGTWSISYKVKAVEDLPRKSGNGVCCSLKMKSGPS
jgi:hypothetical protein